MDVYPVTWSVTDTNDTCRITTCGKTIDGSAVCVHIVFTPFFYVGYDGSLAEGQLLMTTWSKKYDIANSKIVTRKTMWGFTNGRTSHVIQLTFESLAAFRKARYGIGREFQTYEAMVDPLVRLFHLRGIQPCAWIHIRTWHDPEVPTADMDLELETSFTNVGPSECTARPPLVYASWDIEARSATGRFPVADNPEDNLIQISTAFQRYGDPEPFHKSVVCLNETDDVESVDISWSTKEHEVIQRWAQSLRDHKADVLLAYNCHQFDWKYIAGRMGVLVDDETGEPLVDQSVFGRMADGGGDVREFELNSGAYGQNKFFVVQTPGMLQIDLLQYIRREFKLDSYSLDNVSKTFLQQTKLDLPAAQIFAKFLQGPAERADIARYAVRDTELPLRLFAKLNVWENLTEMANAVRVPMDYLMDRGQQIKVYSVILGKARSMGYIIPDNKGIGLPDGAKYEGATVLDAQRGAYFDIVSGLDFASLVSLYIPKIRLHCSTVSVLAWLAANAALATALADFLVAAVLATCFALFF